MGNYLTTNDIGELVAELIEGLPSAAPGYSSHVLLRDGSILVASRGNCTFQIRRGEALYEGWLPHGSIGIPTGEMSERVRLHDPQRFWPFFASPWKGRTRGITHQLAPKTVSPIRWASDTDRTPQKPEERIP